MPDENDIVWVKDEFTGMWEPLRAFTAEELGVYCAKEDEAYA